MHVAHYPRHRHGELVQSNVAVNHDNSERPYKPQHRRYWDAASNFIFRQETTPGKRWAEVSELLDKNEGRDG